MGGSGKSKRKKLNAVMFVAIAIFIGTLALPNIWKFDNRIKAEEIDPVEQEEPGLVPIYSSHCKTAKIKSLYGSWIDVDGSRRDYQHSGVDGGDINTKIISPAPGVIKARWIANWGWGPEGAILIHHSAEDMKLDKSKGSYYSAFYHLKMDAIRGFSPGDRVERGQEIGTVYVPGGKKKYIPEVHWETWHVKQDSYFYWYINASGYAAWKNSTASLVDPLSLFLSEQGEEGKKKYMVPFDKDKDYSEFRGFTYIFPCFK